MLWMKKDGELVYLTSSAFGDWFTLLAVLLVISLPLIAMISLIGVYVMERKI